MGKNIKDEVTPEHLYLNRRRFLKTSIYAATGLATYSTYRFFHRENRPLAVDTELMPTTSSPSSHASDTDKLTAFEHIANYNNFYEFTTDKEDVAPAVQDWKINAWKLEIDGLVDRPMSLSLSDIAALQVREHIYRFRCVEGWSMVIPWLGLPLHQLLEKAVPTAEAKYVAFESYYDPMTMPNAEFSGIPLPYVEGLRLDEAMHPLTLLSTGLYGKNLPNQNGAPIRLVVPWKYGFKSIKSVVRITLTDEEPPTTWNLVNPKEYGFYSNVNPEVDHPRWSQAKERRIGELGLRETLMFNGYGDEVAHLYAGMDLRKNF